MTLFQPRLPVQNFLYGFGLQHKPVYTLGISAGAAFAIKVPKAFYSPEGGATGGNGARAQGRAAPSLRGTEWACRHD